MNKIFYALTLLVIQFSLAQERYEEIYTNKKGVYHITTGTKGQQLYAGTQKGDVVHINQLDSTIAMSKDSKSLILSQAVTPDNKTLVTGDIDGILTVWDVTTMDEPRARLVYHKAAITGITFNRTSTLMFVSSADNEITVWDLKKETKIKTITGHTKPVSSLSLNKSETRLASSSYDGTVKIWDLENYSLNQNINMKGGKVRSVAYSNDEKYIAVALSNKTIRILNTNTFSSAYLLMGHKDVVYQVQFTHDDHYLISGSQDNTVKIWDLSNGQTVKDFNQLANFVNFSFLPDAQSLLIADMTPAIKNWDISGLQLLPKTIDQYDDQEKDENSQANKQAKPHLGITSPKYDNEYYATSESEITVKGNVVSKNKLYKLTINGNEIPINGYSFNYNLRLGVGMTTINVVATDIYNNKTQKSLKIVREIKEGNYDPSKRSGSNYALIIATDEFNEFEDLNNPINDSRSIASKLNETYDFKIDTLFNPSRAEIYTKLRSYNTKVFSDDDQLFIFFAGHGEFDEIFSEGYLVTKDSRADDNIKESFISHSNLRTIIDHIPCKHIFLTMDVCFGGTFDPEVAKSRVKSNAQQISGSFSYVARLYLTSGGKQYVPDGKPGHHSPFTTKLLDILATPKEMLSAYEIQENIREIKPKPQFGSFGENETGSMFLFDKIKTE